MAKVMTRSGGGMFASVRAAAEWVIATGRTSSTDVDYVMNRLSSKGAYGFRWKSREYRITRHGGGLPDETFDSRRDAARWCRETGRAKTTNDRNAMNGMPGPYLGFNWELERIPSGEPAGPTAADGGPIADAIARLEGEIEADGRRIEDLERTLGETRRLLEAKREELESLEALRRANAAAASEGKAEDTSPRERWNGMSADERWLEIVRLRGEGMSKAAIARRFGVSQPAVSYTLRRCEDGGRAPRMA